MEGRPVNKAELIESVCKRTKMTKREATAAVDATLDAIKKGTKRGVTLAGFGTFSVSNRKARVGRNPRTGEEIKIKASKGVRFKAGKAYKSQL
jgi:nucleoid DNA-binding protein